MNCILGFVGSVSAAISTAVNETITVRPAEFSASGEGVHRLRRVLKLALDDSDFLRYYAAG